MPNAITALLDRLRAASDKLRFLGPTLARLTVGIVFMGTGWGKLHRLPEIAAWRRAFSKMGLKPTQYRCASESLLRRLRKEASLPQLHPLADLCNAVSAAFAVPVAVFDVSKITGHLDVRYAAGEEDYLTFSGELEHPRAHEVIFADRAGQVHARRWTNRQSGLSAVQTPTAAALIVAEAMHDSAASDMQELTAAVADELDAVWSLTPMVTVLSQSSPRFTFGQ